MLSNQAKERFAALELPYAAVAVKLHYACPEGVEHVGQTMSFCQFVRHAQETGRHFYMTAEDDDCYGKMVLGMIDKPGLGASGQAGYDFGVFKTPAAGARLYNTFPTLVRGACNFVEFCPVATCDFDPDLVICVAGTRQADILMRATSYISGDLWESKTANIISCAWTYTYPYLSGKVNFCVTGMHHGMKRRKLYPEGLHIIAVPYQKLDEVVQALGEMDWELIAMRDDPQSKAELGRRMDRWKTLDPAFSLKK